MNKHAKRPAKKASVRIERGSGNVFADLGLRDPEERLAKAELAHRIAALIDAEGLTQSQAAARLGIDQPKVSMLVRGRLKDFSVERLMRFLVLLGRDVVIGVEDPRDERYPTLRVLTNA